MEISEKGRTVHLRSLLGQICIFEITFNWDPLTTNSSWPNTSFIASEKLYSPNGRALDPVLEHCGLLRGQLPWHQLSALAWSTYYISSRFKGVAPIYTSFEFQFLPASGRMETSIEKLSERHDERFKLVSIEGYGDGIANFCLQARIRPDPVRYRIDEFPSDFPSRDLTGRAAFISGASRGLGSVLALALGRCGVKVFVNYMICKKEADEVVAQLAGIGAQAWAIQGDVGNEEDCTRMRKFVQKEAGSIDFLVNNASTIAKSYPGATENEVEKNLRMAKLPTEILGTLLGRDGKVIFISSWLPELPKYGFEKYVQAKIMIEKWAADYSISHPEKKVLVVRPRRMHTDQTSASLAMAESAIQVAKEFFGTFF